MRQDGQSYITKQWSKFWSSVWQVHLRCRQVCTPGSQPGPQVSPSGWSQVGPEVFNSWFHPPENNSKPFQARGGLSSFSPQVQLGCQCTAPLLATLEVDPTQCRSSLAAPHPPPPWCWPCCARPRTSSRPRCWWCRCQPLNPRHRPQQQRWCATQEHWSRECQHWGRWVAKCNVWSDGNKPVERL